jgi:hypothetical protein
MKYRSVALVLFIAMHANGQTIGGSSVYNFLSQSNTPQLTALGGINNSNQSNDIGLAFNNPALLNSSMHGQVHAAFSTLYAGIRSYHAMGGYRHEKWKTNLGFGIQFFNYGKIAETDAAGNIFGDFRPIDYVIQISASRTYNVRWRYGVNLKFIHSQYGQYRSSGIALDAGINYVDTSSLLQAALTFKNMGAQIKTYNGSLADDLPFDIQLGISKRLLNAPIQFSVTAHHLHQFDISYNDSVFNNENAFNDNAGGTFDKIFRHFVFATQLYLAEKVEITAAYNHLRRRELNISGTGNGLNGFSMGAGILLKKIQLRYARSYYQSNVSFHQFGVNVGF